MSKAKKRKSKARKKKSAGASKPRKRAKKKRAAKRTKRRAKRRASKIAAIKSNPSGGRITMGKRRKNKNQDKKPTKKGFPTWIKPTLSMVIGGGVGLLAMGLLPAQVAPYAPAVGILGSKFIGGGSWGKYAVTAGVVGGLTFLGNRKTVQTAAGALAAAKNALTSGGGQSAGGGAGSSFGNAADEGRRILERSGVR